MGDVFTNIYNEIFSFDVYIDLSGSREKQLSTVLKH